MGNYSYFEEQQGCIIDAKKLKVLCKLKGLSGYCSRGSNMVELEDDNLGEFMDGWKIQGYWYDDYLRFLYLCADCMKDLTDDEEDNYICMEEEQGYNFSIHFYKEKGKAMVQVNYVPMETKTWKVERKD